MVTHRCCGEAADASSYQSPGKIGCLADLGWHFVARQLHRGHGRSAVAVTWNTQVTPAVNRLIMKSRGTARPDVQHSLSFITRTSAYSAPRIRASEAGPRELEVLGHSVSERKLYLLEHCGDEWPLLRLIHTGGPEFGRLVQAPQYQGATAPPREANQPTREQWVRQLRDRVVPVVPLSLDRWRLQTHVMKRSALRLFAGETPIREYTLRLRVRAKSNALLAAIGAQTIVTAYLRPKARLVAVHRIPRMQMAIATVAYLGVPQDCGVEKTTALLVPLGDKPQRSAS